MQDHHAFLVYADSLAESSLPDFLKSPSANVQHVVVDRFGISDARDLSASARLRPLTGSSQTFVIVVSELAPEAQNALLKLFEEPQGGTVFYLVLKKTVALLPTLQSRLQEIASAQLSTSQLHDEFTSFLHADFAERLESIALKTKQKDAAWIEHILSGCETTAHEDPLSRAELLASVLLVRNYSKSSGASSKMLLEELALQLPVL